MPHARGPAWPHAWERWPAREGRTRQRLALGRTSTCTQPDQAPVCGWAEGVGMAAGPHASLKHTHSPSFFFRRTEREWPALPPSPCITLLPPSSRHAALQDAQRHAGRPPQRLPGRLGPGPGSHRCCVAGGGRRLHAPPGKRKAKFFFCAFNFRREGARTRVRAWVGGRSSARAALPASLVHSRVPMPDLGGGGLRERTSPPAGLPSKHPPKRRRRQRATTTLSIFD